MNNIKIISKGTHGPTGRSREIVVLSYVNGRKKSTTKHQWLDGNDDPLTVRHFHNK